MHLGEASPGIESVAGKERNNGRDKGGIKDGLCVGNEDVSLIKYAVKYQKVPASCPDR